MKVNTQVYQTLTLSRKLNLCSYGHKNRSNIDYYLFMYLFSRWKSLMVSNTFRLLNNNNILV